MARRVLVEDLSSSPQILLEFHQPSKCGFGL